MMYWTEEASNWMSSLWPKYKDTKWTTTSYIFQTLNPLKAEQCAAGKNWVLEFKTIYQHPHGITQGTRRRAQGGNIKHISGKSNPWRPHLTAHTTQRIHYQCPGARYSTDLQALTGGSGESGGRIDASSCLSRFLGYSWAVVWATWMSGHKVFIWKHFTTQVSIPSIHQK